MTALYAPPDPETLRAEIPDRMQAARRWLLWRAEPAEGKKNRKVPYYADGTPRRGVLDTPDDMARLGDFQAVLTALETGRYTGVGFALGADGEGFWQGVDLDDTDHRPELAVLAEALPGYVERSPSGTGVHAIGYGPAAPTLGANRTGIEAYSRGRYFTVTGCARGGNIEDLSAFVRNTLAPLHGAGTPPVSTHREPGRVPVVPVPTDLATDLRSALAVMRSDDRDVWVRMGLALKSLGDTGRGLWLEWSQGSEKFDARDAARKWDSFAPNATDHRAVFAAAQRHGWANPRRAAARTRPAAPDPAPPPAVGMHDQDQRAAVQRDDWPDPADLSGACNAASYPVHVFPELARAAVVEYHNFGQQPLSLVASSALGQMALVAQGLTDIARNAHLRSPISLNLLVAAESGERKSAADKQFGRAARQWQRDQREAQQNENRRKFAMEVDWKARKEGITKQIKAIAAKDSPESKDELSRLQERLIVLEQHPQVAPPLPLLTYEDVTPAALAYSFAKGWPVAGLFSDEGGAVVGGHGMGDETATSMLALLNILWDGRDYVPTRKQAVTAELRGRRFSAFLMVQPNLLPKLIEKGARDIGFIARFLLSAPVSTMGTRFYVEPLDDWPALNDFDAAIVRLLNADLPIEASGEDQGALMILNPPVMRLAANAKQAWVDYHNSVEADLCPFGEFSGVKDIGSKSAENAARLAAVFKVFDQGGAFGELERRYMDAGIAVAAWHLDEARRLFFEVDTPEDQGDARELSAWLSTKALELADDDGQPIVTATGEIALREIQRRGPNRVRDSSRRDTAIALLTKDGHVRPCDNGKQKRLLINPKLLKGQ